LVAVLRARPFPAVITGLVPVISVCEAERSSGRDGRITLDQVRGRRPAMTWGKCVASA